MADVALNLIYNDNGASVAVNSLVSQLYKLETQQWRINISGANVQQLQQLEQAAKRFAETTIRLTHVQTENGVRSVHSFAASFIDLENALKRVNAEINSQKQNLIKAFSTQDFSGIETIKKTLDELALRKEYVESKLNAITLKPAIQEFLSLGEEIERTIKNAVNYSDFINTISGELTSKFSVMRSSGSASPFLSNVPYYRQEAQIREQEEAEKQAAQEAEQRAKSEQHIAEYIQASNQRLKEQEAAQERVLVIAKQRKELEERIATLEAERAAEAERNQKQFDAMWDRAEELYRPFNKHDVLDPLSKEVYDYSEIKKELEELAEERRHEQEEAQKQEEERQKQQAEAQKKYLAEREKAEEESRNKREEGDRKYWQGLSQIISASIRGIQDAYEGLKNIIEAPLNLTGISTLASMLESFEGSLLLDQISSNIISGFSQGAERYDILTSFPSVMEKIGYSVDQSTDAMDRLYKSVLGLPTSFGDIVEATQYFTLMLGDLNKATDLAIAANNAFVASGATSQQVTSGMRQLQYLIEGTQLRSTQWYSLIRSMPIALREVGDALGYPDFASFTAALKEGNVATEDLIDSLIEVGLHSEELGGIIEVMKSRISAALENVTNAGRRMGEGILKVLNEVLEKEGGKGIVENIRGVSTIIDHITEVASDWIRDHGSEIQSLIDKFFSIDWERIVPGFLEGLVKVADRALDNIDTWIDKIGNLITNIKSLFNDFENSQFFVWTKSALSILGDVGSLFGGIALLFSGKKIGGSFGGALASWFAHFTGAEVGATAVGSGISLSGAGLAVAGGTVLASVIDAIYQVIDKGFSEGLSEWASHWQPGVYAAVAIGKYLSTNNADVFNAVVSFLSGMFNVISENGLIETYLSAQMRSSAVSNFAERYSNKYFANKESSEFLNDLAEYLSSGYEDADVIPNVDRLSSYLRLADVIEKHYDDAIEVLEKKKEELLSDIDSLNEELAKRFAGVAINTYDFYEKIYKNGNKFFSEQFGEASGWSYANTTKDRADFLEEQLPVATGIIDEITKYALENYAEDESVLAVVAEFMASFDWNDPEQLAVLVKNYGGKSMQEVFTSYFEQQARNLDLDEAFRTALLKNQIKLKEAEVKNIEDEQKALEEEKEAILSPVIKEIENGIEELESLFGTSIDLIKTNGQKIVNGLNHMFDNLDPSHALSRIDAWFSRVYHEALDWQYRLSNLFPGYSSTDIPREGVYSANGGFMFAPRGTDTIPAMLTPGEFVQRRAAVEHFGREFMNRINQLDLNGALRSLRIAVPYATGGIVKNDSRSYRDNHAVVNQTFNHSSGNFGLRRANRFVRALG